MKINELMIDRQEDLFDKDRTSNFTATFDQN